MNKHNVLSKAEMKNIIGGLACPGWYQAQCLQEAMSQETTGDPIEDQIIFDVYWDTCMRNWDYNPDNPS